MRIACAWTSAHLAIVCSFTTGCVVLLSPLAVQFAGLCPHRSAPGQAHTRRLRAVLLPHPEAGRVLGSAAQAAAQEAPHAGAPLSILVIRSADQVLVCGLGTCMDATVILVAAATVTGEGMTASAGLSGVAQELGCGQQHLQHAGAPAHFRKDPSRVAVMAAGVSRRRVRPKPPDIPIEAQAGFGGHRLID